MKQKSIYKYASEAGVPVGLYLTLMSACLLMSVRISVLPLLLIPLSIGFPVFLWFILRKIGKVEPSYMKFSSLWLGGIYTVIFGTLICMFFSTLYIMFVEPGFVNLYINNAISSIESSPFAGDYEASTRLMKEAIEAHILPSSMEFLTTMAWFTCFTGSVISLILALIIPKTSKKMSGAFGN